MSEHDYLQLFGDFGPTVKGDQLKGWLWDSESARCKCYLSAQDCRDVATQFLVAAASLVGDVPPVDAERAALRAGLVEAQTVLGRLRDLCEAPVYARIAATAAESVAAVLARYPER
jgi:hypothetical protein